MTTFSSRVLTVLALVSCAALTAYNPTAEAAEPRQSVPAPGPVKLVRLENGDRACYVVVQTPRGERSLEGDFELCAGGARDASKLIGQHVIYTTKKAKVLAASCAGNMDCGKSDVVDLVIRLTIAPATVSR